MNTSISRMIPAASRIPAYFLRNAWRHVSPDRALGHPTLLALLEAGATEDEFAYAARNAASKGNAKFAYVLRTVKRQREEAAKLVLHHGRLPNKQEALEESNRAATAGWIGSNL